MFYTVREKHNFLSRRIVPVDMVVDDENAALIIAKVLFLEDQGPEPVILPIRSASWPTPSNALALAGALGDLSVPIVTLLGGEAQLADLLIFQRGSRRILSDETSLHFDPAPLGSLASRAILDLGQYSPVSLIKVETWIAERRVLDADAIVASGIAHFKTTGVTDSRELLQTLARNGY